MKTVSRSGGRSATAAAAYRNAEQITDYRTGEVHDYTRRSGVDAVLPFAPAGMAAPTSAQLWNQAEQAEKRKNSTVAREVLIALPDELRPDQRIALVQQIAQRLADRYRVAGTAAIHQPDQEGDDRNWHTHILMTTRRMAHTGELVGKTRELDAKSTGAGEVKWIRAMVAGEINAALARAGLVERVDHRSLEDQQAAALDAGDQQRADELDRLPTVHEGPTVTDIRRRGGLSRVAQINDDRRELNAQRAELRQVEAEIHLIEDARARRAAELERLHDQLRAYLRDGQTRGWITAAEAQIAADQAKDCGVSRDALSEVVADVGDRQAKYNWEQHQAATPPRSPTPRPSSQILAEGLASLREYRPQQATTEPESAPEWVAWENEHGEHLGEWSDKPGQLWLHDGSKWVECEHAPTPPRPTGPRLG